ncbi:MAG: phosphoserine phosphatase SerB, partial [Thalassotalea sp.]|nr:phosphoserine phosphatase SerB [Thalassotalea sp.]
MSIAVNEISFNHLQSQTLAEYISTTQQPEIFPITCQLNETALKLSQQCQVANDLHVSTTLPELSLTSHIELVLFSDVTFQQLLDITQQCQLEITAISAINHRNSLVSFRFSVNCSNIEKSKAHLANIALTQKIEAALIKDAPKLHQAGILVMDMDSTTIEIECIDEIAALAGVGEEVAAVTEKAMQGELDFAQSLHQRVSKLAGSSESILAEVAKDIPLMNGLETLITELKKYQWRIAIASGGFTYFADHLKDLLALDAAHANVLEIIDNKLTGKVLGDVVDAQAKADCLLSLQKQY